MPRRPSDRGSGNPDATTSRVLGVVSCHVERPLDDPTWMRFAGFQRSLPGGFRIAALIRPPAPEEGEREDVWLDRAAVAGEQGPLGHHTHFGGVGRARPPVPHLAPDHVRHEAEWLRARNLAPRFWCGGGWYFTPAIAAVLCDFGYVDCSATAFPLDYLPSGAPHLRLDQPRSLVLEDGRSLLELPATHTLRMAAKLAVSPGGTRARVVHVCFHDWELTDRRRTLALRAVLARLGGRCRRSDLAELADQVRESAPELAFVAG
jgi:hypothetical protein